MNERNETTFEYNRHKITVIDLEKTENRFAMNIVGPVLNIEVEGTSLTHLVEVIKTRLESIEVSK